MEVVFRSEQPAAVGGRVCSVKRGRCLLVPAWICACLAWEFHGLLGKWNLLLRDQQELHLVLLIRRVIQLRDRIFMSRVRRRTCTLGRLRSSWRLSSVPWTTRRSNQSILKEVSPEYSLEGLMLKLQYFGHLMRRTDSLGKTLVVGRLKAGGKGDDRGWDGWMASPIWWTGVWVSSGSWQWTGKPGVLQSMRSQKVECDWVTELNWFHYMPKEHIILSLSFMLYTVQPYEVGRIINPIS